MRRGLGVVKGVRDRVLETEEPKLFLEKLWKNNADKKIMQTKSNAEK